MSLKGIHIQQASAVITVSIPLVTFVFWKRNCHEHLTDQFFTVVYGEKFIFLVFCNQVIVFVIMVHAELYQKYYCTLSHVAFKLHLKKNLSSS